MVIKMIVAKSKNNVIGKDNQLIWNIPEDLKYFKEQTLNKTILMGRKTYESIGRPLPNRRNVVLTRDKDFLVDGVDVVHSIEDALELKDLIVIGGETLYSQFMEYADEILITEIEEEFEGDTYFPEVRPDMWRKVNSSELKNNGRLNFKFVTYKKHFDFSI